MATETVKYATRLAQTKEQKDSSLASPRAAETRVKFQHEITKIDIQVAEQSNRLEELKGVYPLNVDEIVKGVNQIALLERQKKVMSEVLTELF